MTVITATITGFFLLWLGTLATYVAFTTAVVACGRASFRTISCLVGAVATVKAAAVSGCLEIHTEALCNVIFKAEDAIK